MDEFGPSPTPCPKCGEQYHFVMRCKICKNAYCNTHLNIPWNAIFVGNLQMIPCPEAECNGILELSEFEADGN